jgi:uncharacterized membrane protein YphA (DoxX/SURF4 family)
MRLETYGVWAARLLLSGLFLWAASGKIIDPQAFARALWNYRLLPEPLVPAVAAGLPLLEALAALALLAPPLQKGASLVLAGLLVVFSFGLASALLRGLDVDCGCFGEGSSHVSPLLLVRNVLLLSLAVWSYLRAPMP